MDRIIETLARELGKDPRHVENVVRLLDEGPQKALMRAHEEAILAQLGITRE